jgi:outer membrane protein, multidrug efflux system
MAITMNRRTGEHYTAPFTATLLVVYGLLASGLLGCNAGPNYERPAVATPASFRGGPEGAERSSAASFADQRWWQLFDDERLRGLIQTALEQNYDCRIAAARVLEAEAQLGVADSAQLPTLSGQLSAQGSQTLAGGRAFDTGNSFSAGLSASWEVDFWGKFRRANESARAEMLGSEWGRRASIQTLVAQVASSYFTLRALDQQHAIAERSLAARRESLRLTERREQSGAGSLIDVRQAEQLVYLADGERVELARSIEQRENLLSTLLGLHPGPVARGQSLADQKLPPELPAGLPSGLLERRPDIQVAEHQLISANAQIGVAASEYFPQLTLTGSGGLVSDALLALFSSPGVLLNAAGSLVQPLFNAGRVRAGVMAADARTEQAALVYRQTIVQALREVSDSLVGFRRSRELRVSRDALLQSAGQARALAELRYQSGTSSYLEVLDADTRLLSADFAVVQAQLDLLLSYVELYRALGGGWQV